MDVVTSKKFEDEKDDSVQCEFVTEDGHRVYSGFWLTEGHLPIVSISTQVGCRVRCRQICNVPRFRRSLTPYEISAQIHHVLLAASGHGLKMPDKYKVSMVKEGEPLLNENFLRILFEISRCNCMPIKVSTTLPDTEQALQNLNGLIGFASQYSEFVQVQISLGSTDQEFRKKLTALPVLDFKRIAEFGEKWHREVGVLHPEMSKLMLTMTIYNETPCSPDDILEILPPGNFVIRVRNASVTKATPDGMSALTQERYEQLESAFTSKGYTFIDGRSAPLAMKESLTIGVYQIGNSLRSENEDCSDGCGEMRDFSVFGSAVTNDAGHPIRLLHPYARMPEDALHATADELETAMANMDRKSPEFEEAARRYGELVAEEMDRFSLGLGKL